MCMTVMQACRLVGGRGSSQSINSGSQEEAGRGTNYRNGLIQVRGGGGGGGGV